MVREQAWTDSLRALGTVHAREAVTVTAKVSETVQQVHFESGQDVARGAPLVTLSGQQQQASLASAEATLKEAEQLYQRQAQLASQQLVARASLDAQRATRDAARAQVAQIRGPLGHGGEAGIGGSPVAGENLALRRQHAEGEDELVMGGPGGVGQ